jgi:heme exporter protein D
VTAPTLGILVPEPTVTTWLAVAAVLIVLVVVTVTCVLRARRLDRLHRRTDAARAGLADALERRGTVALRVADVLRDGRPRVPRPQTTAWSSGAGSEPPRGPVRRSPSRPDDAAVLRAAAHDALTACRAGMRTAGAGFEACEVAENALTRRIAAVDRAALPAGLSGELLDAEQLVMLARRVHNDAVRDTLDLRSRRLVRWLRLAGTAPAPGYFEIADPPRRDVTTPPPFAGAATTEPAVSGTGAGSGTGVGG